MGLMLLLSGKYESFQLINGADNASLDFFFRYITYAGDGYMWAAVLLFCIFFKKKYIAAVIAAIIISTLLSQFLKRVVFPEDLRPITYLSDSFPVHIIEGIKMNRMFSFPSGHSTAAFTMALIVAHMLNNRYWSFILPVLALLVAYSRVYLAQHFLTDVLAGLVLGVFSTIISLLIHRAIIRAINKKTSTTDSLGG